MEAPSSPSNNHPGEANTSSVAPAGSKPIKKKTQLFTSEDLGAEDSPEESNSPPFSPPSMKELEAKAKRELIAFLESKNVDPKYADVYQVHVGIQKKRKSGGASDHSRKSDGPGYSVTYSSPDGSILISRGDVLAAIQESKKRNSLSQSKAAAHSGGNYAHKRSEAHAQAKQRLHDALTQLPMEIDGITVHSFGHLDTRSGFETSVQLYPVGYKCEQTVSYVNFFKGPSQHRVVCEVGELEGFPEFRITIKSNGDTFIASTEAAVWRKFNPSNVESEWQPSFFNLEVELLLEGLQGAEMCDTYRFHVERGYGTQYFTQDEAVAAKAAYLAKSGREKRNQERQKARLLTKEEMDRLQELELKRQADEKELAKKLALVEKERKDQEKEELKRLKAEQKAVEQARREEERAEEQRRKEANKSMEKAQREQTKKNEKFRAQFKKEINSELRKNRSDANSAVLQCFDDEELVFEQQELAAGGKPTTAPIANSSAGLADFLANLTEAPLPASTLESLHSSGKTGTAALGTSLDDVIKLTNTLHLFKRHLQIETPIRLDGLVQNMSLLSKAPALRPRSAPATASTAAGGGSGTSGAMEVEETTTEVAVVKAEAAAEEDEAEFDEGGNANANTAVATTTATPASAPAELTEEMRLALAEADLDQIQLKMMRHLLKELRDILDIADPSAPDASTSTAKGKGSGPNMSKAAASRLPLNQLTFAELARLAILNHLYQEQGHERETIQHLLRGAKASNFRLTKNVIRNIRYRLAVQTKLPAKAEEGGNAAADAGAVVVCGDCSTNMCDANGQPLQFLGAQVSAESRLACMDATAVGDRKDMTRKGIDPATLAGYQQRIGHQNNLFSSEKEIIQCLEQITTGNSADPAVLALPHADYSDAYKRCSRVLVRILNLAQSRNLIWEVDASLYPDYYTTIRRPVMYTGIAAALIHKRYSFPECAADGVDEEVLVAALFAADLMQVPINCITYNSEVSGFVSQAYKMIHASHRLLRAWLHGPELPPLTTLAENFCVLTQEYIAPHDALKCGKCTAMFCRSALDDLASAQIGAEYAPYYVAPTQEIVEQQNEEWICPLCLHEDSQQLTKTLHPTSLAAIYAAPFSIDEWGPSTKVPWLWNEAHSTASAGIEQHLPYLSPYLGALKVLSKTDSTAVLPIAPGTGPILPTILTKGYKHSTKSITQRDTPIASTSVATWSFAERVTVLLALAVVFRSNERAMDFMQSINADCEKLIKISSKPNFREADFMSAVKDLLGDEGVLLCRSLLDGMEGRAEEYLQQQVTEGRCVVCNHSTFEEDMQQARGTNDEEGETKEDEVLLCDGCNAEVHLRCLNLTAVPSAEWHCNLCKERIALRESKHSSLTQFEGSSSIEKHRNKTEEEALLNTVIDKRISAISTTGKVKDKEKSELQSGSSASLSAMEPGPDEDKCVYCGLGELELCSPFVVGQSRAEHEAVLQLAAQKPTADDFYPGTTGTAVLFLNQGKPMPGPGVEFPYFPPANSPKGEVLIKAYRDTEAGQPLIAHQLCALQMFQARITRSRHTLRRRNKVVGQRAVSMTGISVLPLGYDDAGREYWKFPVCEDLFICTQPRSDDCQAEFQAYLESTRAEFEGNLRMDVEGESQGDKKVRATDSAAADRGWRRISEPAQIRRVVELLGASAAEQNLRTSIINALLLERAAPAAAAVPASASADTNGAAESKSEDGAEETKTANPDAGTLNSWIDRSRSSTSLERGNSTEDLRPLAKKPAVDLVPAGMRLITARGQDILPSYVIQQESVFEEDAVDSDAEEEGEDGENVPVNEFFTFNKGRKYYAIALVNKEGTVLKMGGTAKVQGLTVVYQIHREGIAAPLSYAPLSEAWSDHMYYFATVTFKRSGRYTISFITEGENAASIKPLIYPVVVEARTVRCGIPHALDRLYALQYLDALNRAVLIGRRDLMAAVDQCYNEVDAVRAALLMVYLALPSGALVQDLAQDNATFARGNSFALITEPAGWNDILDQAWRGAVLQATTPTQLMECALLLEHYISKQWLNYPQSRLLSALPNPHFALTCSTFSAVALRVYCLDKALMYDKVVTAPRERRSMGTFDAYAYEEPARGASQSSAAAAAALQARGKRPAAAQASARIKSTVNYNEDSEDEDDAGSVGEAQRAPQQPQPWDCVECTVSNEPRARSCCSCGARKPTASGAPAQQGRTSTGSRGAAKQREVRASKSRRVVDSEEEEEDEESDSEGSDEESGDGSDSQQSDAQDSASDGGGRGGRSSRNSSSRPRSSSRNSEDVPERKSARARNSVQYFEDSGDEDDEEVTGPSSGSKRRAEQQAGGSGSKRVKDKSEEDYLAEYKRGIPARVAAISAEIASRADKASAGDAAADMQMRCLSILRQLVADVKTELFWEPVDTRQVPGYLDLIKHPMDLGTIEKKVKAGAYGKDAEKFMTDVRLVWSNCKTFNSDFSLLSHYAGLLGTKCEGLYSKWIAAADRPANPDVQ